MTGARFGWRALRPALLAGAATLTWLTFSSPAASADTLSESALGNVTASVSTLTGTLTEALPVPAHHSQPGQAAQQNGLLGLAVTPLANSADDLITSLPLVHQVVPAGIASAITTPVATAADAVLTGTANAVLPPLADAVPVLEPVVQPVTDLVTGTTPLPAALPSLTDEPAVGTNGQPAPDAAPGQVDADAAATPAFGTAGAAAVQQSTSYAGTSGVSGITAFVSYGASVLNVPTIVTDDPSPLGTSPRPLPAPAAPAAGSGSSSAAPTGGSAAAWLNPFTLYLPLSGNSPLSSFSEHSPSPVSFDPGSSPD